MSAIKISNEDSHGRNFDIYQITDMTSPDPKIALSVAYGQPLYNNTVKFLSEIYTHIFITDLIPTIEKYQKLMIIIDVSNFPYIAVSYSYTKDDLINNESDIGIKLNKYYEQFTWENKIFPVLFVNLMASFTGLCIYDYNNKKYLEE